MPTIGKIKVALTGETRQFDRSMRRSASQVDTLQRKFRSFRGAIAPLVGAAGFGSLIRSTVTEGERMAQLAKRLGTTVESFSRLSRVLGRSGISLDQTGTIVQRLQRRAVEARDGNDALAKSFARVGVNVTALLALDPVEAFLRFGEALARIERPADRIFNAFKVLDQEGVQVLQADLLALRSQMEATSALSAGQAQSITRLAEAWAKLGEKMRAITAIGIEKLKLPEGLSGVAGFVGDVPEKGLLATYGERYVRGMAESIASIATYLGLAPPAATSSTHAGLASTGAGRFTNVPPETGRTGRIQGTGLFTGGDLAPSNEIITQLRAISRNTEKAGAVLQ